MIRFRLKELIAEKGFRDRRVVTIGEVAEKTGINRATLSKIANVHGYNTGTDNVDRLCVYFECTVADVMEHLPDAPARSSRK